MTEIPRTEDPLVVRADFSDAAAWAALREAIQESVGEDQSRAYVDFLDKPSFDGLTADRLRHFIPESYGHTFIFLVDRETLVHPDRPILVMDLADEPGRTFRVIPSEMWAVENNLSTGNMGFSEFADNLDEDGIFRA